MPDPISSVVRFPPVQPASRTTSAADPGQPPAAAVQPPPAAPPPKPAVALSVGRDASGVFVYTLTDSSNGRVLAVIPRSAVVAPASGGGGEGLDIQA